MERDVLISSIASTIKNYRKGEIERIDSDHVERWINQFEEEYQLTILSEMDHILKNMYCSRKEVKSFIKSLLTAENVFGTNPKATLSTINFLNIQSKGSSQKDLLEVTKDILLEEYDLKLNNCGGSNKYLYIDDCVYSGNRFKHDIVNWINDYDIPCGSEIITYHICLHSEGFKYAMKNINKCTNKKNIIINNYRHFEINNNRFKNSDLEVLWPRKFEDDEFVNEYCKNVEKRCEENDWPLYLFRKNTIVNNDSLFSSPKARDIVEKAFLKEGARLVMAAEDPAPSVRPLGFEKLESLGFGTLFATYRNISNNCPLVLWYGDPDNYDPPHPFSLWYPLLPRKVNKTKIDWGDILF